MTVAVDFKNVDIVFGADQAGSLAMIDAGRDPRRDPREDRQRAGLRRRQPDRATRARSRVLMGLSGSGKSTLLRAVNRLNMVSRGQVLVKDGDKMVDVVTCDEATLRRLRQQQVAMVFQQFGLLPWRTVEENVGLGLELAGVPEAERKETRRQAAQAGQSRPLGEEIRA